jgi:hypothetical protein
VKATDWGGALGPDNPKYKSLVEPITEKDWMDTLLNIVSFLWIVVQT